MMQKLKFVRFRIYVMNTISEVFAFYSKFNSDLLFERASILGVVLSAILTRGVDQVSIS